MDEVVHGKFPVVVSEFKQNWKSGRILRKIKRLTSHDNKGTKRHIFVALFPELTKTVTE
jgi:sugar diacid utilization regulator